MMILVMSWIINGGGKEQFLHKLCATRTLRLPQQRGESKLPYWAYLTLRVQEKQVRKKLLWNIGRTHDFLKFLLIIRSFTALSEMKCNVNSVNTDHRGVLGLVCVSKIKVMFKFFHKLCSHITSRYYKWALIWWYRIKIVVETILAFEVKTSM